MRSFEYIEKGKILEKIKERPDDKKSDRLIECKPNQSAKLLSIVYYIVIFSSILLVIFHSFSVCTLENIYRWRYKK